MNWPVSPLLLILAVVCHGQAPLDAEQTRMLEEARRTALNYTKGLPDFICTESIQRSEGYGPKGSFKNTDTLTVQLTYFQLHEHYKLVARNNRPTRQSMESVGGASSQGEFGSTLLLIFHPSSQAEFGFRDWAQIGDRRVAVFTFRVERANSHFAMRNAVESVISGYHGEVYIDAATLLALRITEVIDIPDGFPVEYSRNTVDYEFVDVGGRQYLLPARCESVSADLPSVRGPYGATVRRAGPQLANQTRYRNVIEFRDYQKYAADSRLSFDTPGPPKQ